MGIGDRRYGRDGGRGGGGPPDFGEGGGLRRALRRIFVEGDDFFSWALPLYRVGGILVRIHLLYIVFIVTQLIWRVNPAVVGWPQTIFFLSSGFVFVLLHEYGHCLACRMVGGEADEILMWPLGGLAMCVPPNDWKSHLITTVCGPLVNVVLAGAIGATMLALGAGWESVLINPFEPWRSVMADPWHTVNAAYWKHFLFAAYIANVYLVLFNVCLPMFPMDGGRILQELLWWRLGKRKATTIAVNVGLVAAVCVGVFAFTIENQTLLGIALFAGLTCFNERRKLSFIDDQPDWAVAAGPTRDERRKYDSALKAQERERQKQAEVDRILAKIAAQGMGSLTRGEKAALAEATERKRTVG